MLDFALLIAVLTLLVEFISLSFQIAEYIKESKNDRPSHKH